MIPLRHNLPQLNGRVIGEGKSRAGLGAHIDRFQKGNYVGSIYGHGGSIREPYDTLRLYQGKSIAVPGCHGTRRRVEKSGSITRSP